MTEPDKDQSIGIRRIAMRIMYDGTDFYGWQRQREGRTVQGELERMLSAIGGNVPVSVVAAGRTDSGVHAHGQVAHADIATRYDDAELLHALERMAPADLAMTDLATVDPSFHARYHATERRYRYRILITHDPFRRRYAWLAPQQPDIDALHAASAALVGAYDFTALSKHNPDTLNPVCRVAHTEWEQQGDEYVFHIAADRFLYGMVRLIVGLQFDIARGVRSVGDIPEILEGRDRNTQSPAAPACGLSLVHVGYPADPFPHIMSSTGNRSIYSDL